MIILGIDTSCDDTSVAVVEAKNNHYRVLSSVVSSQIKLHQPYGGVYPTLAKREHQKNLIPSLKQALKQAGRLKKQSQTPISNKLNQTLDIIFQKEITLLESFIKFSQEYTIEKINLIAITIGPGLEPCLWTGVNLSRALEEWLKKPVVGVNHLRGHIVANWLEFKNPPLISQIKSREMFPAVALVVSGGHTELIVVKRMGVYKKIGQTRDDAAGECFDKTARIMGLGYPGGPAIAKAAKRATKKFNIHLPRPMINTPDYDFSFSGLKTAVLYEYRKRKKKTRQNPDYVAEMAYEIQQAIVDVLVYKTLKAAKQYRAKSVILGGGVAANRVLRNLFQERTKKLGINFFAPPKIFCTDNAAMIALEGYLQRHRATRDWKKIRANANLNI